MSGCSGIKQHARHELALFGCAGHDSSVSVGKEKLRKVGAHFPDTLLVYCAMGGDCAYHDMCCNFFFELWI